MLSRTRKHFAIALVALALVLGVTGSVLAHQPYFEDVDFTAAAPYQVADATISTAVYATLATADDVDYYEFDGKAGQSILLAMTIPQIAGQEAFTPTIALLHPDLPAADLPKRIERPRNSGALLLRAAPGAAETFYEPFSRTSYWDRQEERVTLPADGRYVVAVWNERGNIGRYTFVIGDREVFGGDRAFSRKLGAYWTPLPKPEKPATPAVSKSQQTHRCGEDD